jgi:hypothetical protein
MRTIFKKVAMFNGIALFAFMLLAPSNSIGQTLENDNQKTSVYLHPVSLIAGFAGMGIEGFYLPIWFNLTGEIPLSERYALIVNPSLVYMYEDEDETGKAFFVGSGVGIRRFVNGNADGLYLQIMPYINYGKGNHWGDDGEDSFSSINADILGYIGYSIKYSKISLFFDIGIGYGISHYLSLSNKELFINENDEIRLSGLGAKNGLSIDINIGVGMPLL